MGGPVHVARHGRRDRRHVRRAGRQATAVRQERHVRPGRRGAFQQRAAAGLRGQVPRAVRIAQQRPDIAVDAAAGRPVAGDGLPAVRTQRHVRAHGLRAAAGQHSDGLRVQRHIPGRAPAVEPTHAQETPGRGREPGPVRFQRQPGVGQHALDHPRSVAHRARRSTSWRHASHAFRNFA